MSSAAPSHPTTRPSNGGRPNRRPGRALVPHARCGGSAPSARVAVVSASVGGGHNAAADELGRRLRAAGYGVDRHEFLDMFPFGTGRALSALYGRQLAVAPGSWGLLCRLLSLRLVVRALAAVITVLTGRALRRQVGPAVAVVSTYPLANQVLARLRRRGRLPAPTLTYLTDVSVHPLWVAAGLDGYLAAHTITAGQAAALGAEGVRLVTPAVRAQFRRAGSADRSRWGLPEAGRLALVVGGAWGAGDVAATARDIAAGGVATPVVVCATNTALRAELSADATGVALGWVDDMAGLMRCCDVVVTNGGGLTTVEALTLGRPVLVYRQLPGHGLTNAMAFDSAGLARWVRTRDELPAALDTPLAPLPAESGTDPAAVVAELAAAATPAGATR